MKNLKNKKMAESLETVHTHTHTHTHTQCILEDSVKEKIKSWFILENKMSLKSASGITLVALVITIVILVILAGVSINLALRRKWGFNQSTTSSGKV